MKGSITHIHTGKEILKGIESSSKKENPIQESTNMILIHGELLGNAHHPTPIANAFKPNCEQWAKRKNQTTRPKKMKKDAVRMPRPHNPRISLTRYRHIKETD